MDWKVKLTLSVLFSNLFLGGQLSEPVVGLSKGKELWTLLVISVDNGKCKGALITRIISDG